MTLPVVLILAAGAGRRLAPLTDDRPKPMVEIDGEPILRRMLAGLAAAGFRHVAIVTGHRAELIDAFLDSNPSDLSIRRLWNPSYATTNTVGSFAFAGDALADGFCLLNGDLVFDPSVLVDLAVAGSGVHLVTDLDEPLGDEEMKVQVDDRGCAIQISKKLKAESCVGEFTGISRFDPPAAALMIEAARRLVSTGRADAYYEDAFNLVAGSMEANLLPTRGRAWTEIDDLADYERAIGVVRSVSASPPRP
jgi:choline kinase